jgi:hypothetical protein
LPAGHQRPGRNDLLELGLLAPLVRRRRAAETVGEEFRASRHAAHDLADRLTAMIEHLHERTDADRHQEGDDECRYRAP